MFFAWFIVLVLRWYVVHLGYEPWPLEVLVLFPLLVQDVCDKGSKS